MTDDHEVLAPTQQGSLIPAKSASFADALPAIKAKMEALQTIQAYIDKKVNPATDFDQFEGKVRRNHSYAKKVFGVVGGSFEWLKDPQGRPLVIKHQYKDDEGEYYVYEAYGRYTPPGGDPVEASGMFSSRDKFFGKKSGEFRDVSDVDERSVRQAAQTECFKKCIFTALGYGEATQADLQKLGVKTDESEGHQFSKGTQGGNTDDGDQRDKRDEIKRMCIDLQFRGVQDDNGDELDSPEAVLTHLTKSKNGKFSGWRSFDKISAKGLEPSYKQIKEAYDKLCEDAG